MRAADPVEDPHGYQEFVLSYLGDDDPAEVQQKTPAILRELGGRAGDEVRTRPAEGEWSVLECIGHITGAEIVSTARYRWIVAQEEPTLVPYDQNLWVERLRAETGSGFPEKVTAFREGMAVHGRYGQPCPRCGAKVQRIRYAANETNYCVRLIAGHDRVHAEQAARTLDAIRTR